MAGLTADTDGSVSRWFSQKWVLDNLIAILGFDAVTANVLSVAQTAIGPDVSREVLGLRQRVKKFSDIEREVAKAGERRESKAKEAGSSGHRVTARENYFIASLLYGVARWAVWDGEGQEIRDLNSKVASCYDEYAKRATYPIERLEIPFEGKRRLHAFLHLPRTGNERFPCVVYIPGMDNFKELLVRMYGDKLLERGFAVLALDGPGQGETLINGTKVTLDNFERAGKVVVDHLSKRKEIDASRIVLRGRSFGTYWGPRVMAAEPRFKAGAFMAVCHEPGAKTLFGSSTPTYKLRHMWIAGYKDERKFDEEYASKLSLEGIGRKIKSPTLFLAGEDDDLSPIRYTYDFFDDIAGPKRLMVYEGATHGVGDPNADNIQADFLMDQLSGKALKGSEMLYVEIGGRITRRPLKGQS